MSHMPVSSQPEGGAVLASGSTLADPLSGTSEGVTEELARDTMYIVSVADDELLTLDLPEEPPAGSQVWVTVFVTTEVFTGGVTVECQGSDLIQGQQAFVSLPLDYSDSPARFAFFYYGDGCWVHYAFNTGF